MKFLHVADLHLDRSFEGLGLLPQKLSEQLLESNIDAFKQIVTCGIEKQVDFILIVGDTFHHPHVTIQMQALFLAELERLNKAEIPVILTFGNHDYFQRERYWFEFPKNVYLFTEEEVTSIQLTTKKGERVEIAGFSYQNRWISDDKLKDFPIRQAFVDYQIGCYHGQVNENGETGRYAPFRLAEMKQKGYDYWALGHIHQPQVLSEQPLIIYPGTPQGHSIKEAQVNGVILADFSEGDTQITWLPVAQVEWKQLNVTISETHNLKESLSLIEETLINQSSSQLQLVRVNLLGAPREGSAELERELSNQGLLSFIQSKVYQETQERVWLYQLKQAVAQDQRVNLPLGIDQSLLSQLSQRYLAEETYHQAIEGLLSQALLATQIAEPLEVIQGAQQKIIQGLEWQEEVE